MQHWQQQQTLQGWWSDDLWQSWSPWSQTQWRHLHDSSPYLVCKERNNVWRVHCFKQWESALHVLCSLIRGFGHERGRPHCDRGGRTKESGGEHNMLGTAQFPAHAELLSSFISALCVSIKTQVCRRSQRRLHPRRARVPLHYMTRSAATQSLPVTPCDKFRNVEVDARRGSFSVN